MRYVVWYKSPGFLSRWKKVKGVTGDTIVETDNNQAMPVRVLFLENKERLEIPMSFLIRFSQERFYDIKDQMEQEAGQTLPIKKGRRTKGGE